MFSETEFQKMETYEYTVKTTKYATVQSKSTLYCTSIRLCGLWGGGSMDGIGQPKI